jgi:hypothetical protein
MRISKINGRKIVDIINIVLVCLLFLNGTIILLGKSSRFPYFGVLILLTFFSIALLHVQNFIFIFRQVHHHEVFKKGLGIICFVMAFFILFMQFGVIKTIKTNYKNKL